MPNRSVISMQGGIYFLLLVSLLAGCHSSKKATPGQEKPGAVFTFFVLGDWGTKGKGNQLPVAREMIKQSKQHPLSMIVTVGDNFYEDGVTGIDDEHWKLSYEDVYGELTRNYPWYIALGNHDYRGNIAALTDYHKINSNWNMPDKYYTFVASLPNKEKARFLVIDTDPYIPSYYSDPHYKEVMAQQDTARQTRWIDSVLASAGEEWKIVVGHHPLYYANAKRPDTMTLVRVMEPLFEKYHVQAYIAGHVHDIQYNQPADTRVAHIISGSGAKTIRPTPKSDYTLFSSTAPAFTVCSIQDDRMTVQFIDTTGNAIYQHTIQRN